MASSLYVGQLLPGPSLTPSTCTMVSSGQLPVPQISKIPGLALLVIFNMLCLPLMFCVTIFLYLCNTAHAMLQSRRFLEACKFQQSELQFLLKWRLLLTKLHQSHSFVNTPDNSRGQERTILRDLLLCFSVFNLLLLKLRERKEEERQRKASRQVRGPKLLHPSQDPSVLGFIPLCLSLLCSQPQSRTYC